MIKYLNSYRITHSNGQAETVTAGSITSAIKNVTLSEEESSVTEAILAQRDVRVDVPDVVKFTTKAVDIDGGEALLNMRTTPKDVFCLTELPVEISTEGDEDYEFVEWRLNGTKISEEPTINYVFMQATQEDETLVFEAMFRKRKVVWSASPATQDEIDAGNQVFPVDGVISFDATVKVAAVAARGYEFEKWTTTDGTVLSTDPILTTPAVSYPLVDGEIKIQAHFVEA